MTLKSQHYTLASQEGEAFWFIGTLATIKASGTLTGNIMSLVEFVHPPGFATPLHVHQAEDEAFYILEGAIRGITDGQLWYAGKGAFVWLPRGTAHGYAVVGDEEAKTLAITMPAGFDRFVVSVGDPALERVLPPPTALDIPRLVAASADAGQDILGPLVLP